MVLKWERARWRSRSREIMELHGNFLKGERLEHVFIQQIFIGHLPCARPILGDRDAVENVKVLIPMEYISQ